MNTEILDLPNALEKTRIGPSNLLCNTVLIVAYSIEQDTQMVGCLGKAGQVNSVNQG